MSAIDPTKTTLGDLVTREPRAASLFEQLGIDYCCGGHRTLAEAAAQRGLDATTLAVLVEGFPREDDRSTVEPHDVARSSMGDLCDHIVVAHHDRLRRELPAIDELVATVVRVHGGEHRELSDLQRTFEGLRHELEVHLDIEERELFPACRRLERSIAPGEEFDASLLALMEDEHDAVGAALVALRELCGDYDESRALCGTHRRLLRALHALERDLHQHVHEENNILFGKLRARLGVPG
jgi:regulator of cell morphogenesis and NO signaling